jgi:hypothetical protein
MKSWAGTGKASSVAATAAAAVRGAKRMRRSFLALFSWPDDNDREPVRASVPRENFAGLRMDRVTAHPCAS